MIWLIDAVLKWLPGFRSSYMSNIMGAGMGQPGWLQWWFHLWINLQNPAPTFFAYLVAVLETLVALAVILGFARKVSYIASAVFCVVIWAAAEGFGGPYGSGASDIGTAIIYALVFMCLLTLAAYTGTDRYSADYYLEQKISWWHKVAEVGHLQEQPVPAAVVPAQSAGPAMPLVPEVDGAPPELVAR
jgi:nitrite reductase (NO-forming)